MLKNYQVFESKEQRNSKIAAQFIRRNIPKKSKIIGDPLFFYAAVKAGSDYQYFDLFNTLIERETAQRKVYNYDYLIISDQSKQRNIEITKYYLKMAEFDTIAILYLSQTEGSKFVNNLGLVSEMEQFGYSSIILKRKK